MADIITVMDRHRREVLAKEVRALAEMRKAYRSVEVYLQANLAKIQKMIADAEKAGDSTGAYMFEQARWKILIAETEKELERFSRAAESQTEKGQAEFALMGQQHANAAIVAEVKVKRAFASLNKSAIESMVGVFRNGSPLRTLFATIAPDSVAAARTIMVSGVASGEGPRVTAQRLADTISDLALTRAETIARNETLRVLTLAQQRTYEANSDVVTGSRIIAALDSRTCPLCWMRHGTILKPGEPFHRHVCCRCSLAPQTIFSRSWATGEEEFALMPETLQKEILGKSRFDLWQSGKIRGEDIYRLSDHADWGPQIGLKNLGSLSRSIKPDGTYAKPVIAQGTESVIKTRESRGIITK